MIDSDCCLRVPADALAIPDYNAPEPERGKVRKKIPPMEGDPIDVSLRGTVTAIEGGVATVHIAFVNGERLSRAESGKQKAETDAGKDDAAENEAPSKPLTTAAGATLRNKARKADAIRPKS
jgi:hypothetical protein